MNPSKEVWGVYCLEDTDDDVAFYCIALFYNNQQAEDLRKNLIDCIEKAIDDMEDKDEEFFTVDHCDDEVLKEFLENADLKDGIRVRSCSYKIYVASEIIYT